MGVTYDDLPDHEGYAEAKRRANVACCSCGWRGGTFREGDAGREAAIGEWRVTHVAGLLRSCVPAPTADLVAETRRALDQLSEHRPEAAEKVLRELRDWAAAALTRTVPALESDLRRRPGRSGLSL